MDPAWLSMNITGDHGANGNSSNSSLLDLSTFALLDQTTRTCMVVLFSATSVLALVGNLIVIIVETFGRRSAANLRKFLINLAISDIVFGVFSVPFTYTNFMYGQWIFSPWLCPWAQFIQILSIFITSFTLTLISIERLVALFAASGEQINYGTYQLMEKVNGAIKRVSTMFMSLRLDCVKCWRENISAH